MAPPLVYRCEECGRTFKDDRPDADARAHAEAVENFGRRGDAPGMARVCDACFRELMAALE